MYIILLILCLRTIGIAQTVSVKDGNVYFHTQGGQTVQITNYGLDSDPSLSSDARLVVFVRRTPSLKIETGMGDAEENELWIASTSGEQPPRRVLVGHPGGFRMDDELVLAGFWSPKFSPDASRVYFMSTVWATSSSIRMLDLRSGQERFLCAGSDFEVIVSGRYSGHLIVSKLIPRALSPPRVFRYWLLDPEGKEIGEIGETKADVEEFKRFWKIE